MVRLALGPCAGTRNNIPDADSNYEYGLVKCSYSRFHLPAEMLFPIAISPHSCGPRLRLSLRSFLAGALEPTNR